MRWPGEPRRFREIGACLRTDRDGAQTSGNSPIGSGTLHRHEKNRTDSFPHRLRSWSRMRICAGKDIGFRTAAHFNTHMNKCSSIEEVAVRQVHSRRSCANAPRLRGVPETRQAWRGRVLPRFLNARPWGGLPAGIAQPLAWAFGAGFYGPKIAYGGQNGRATGKNSSSTCDKTIAGKDLLDTQCLVRPADPPEELPRTRAPDIRGAHPSGGSKGARRGRRVLRWHVIAIRTSPRDGNGKVRKPQSSPDG